MENIYNIRKNEQLLFIQSLDHTTIEKNTSIDAQCAVFVNLYYLDTVERYMEYLNRIPNWITIYIYSSDSRVLKRAEKLQKRSSIVYQKKENQGRDISALFVAAAKLALQYNYICFLHDKKANANYLKEDVNLWIENLWGNMVGSEAYIANLLEIFKKNPEIGLLVPPEAFGRYISHWYGDTWLVNYPLCRLLAEDLEIYADIAEEKLPFTIGTVFWARTDALKLLLEKQWDYGDFPPEPLDIDGTISHAAERILGYAAQDAGYKVGTVMSENYASWLLLSAQEYMREMFMQLKKREHIHNMDQIFHLDIREKSIKDFCCRFKKIYIYGAGNYGKSLYHFLKDRDWMIDGFVVSSGKRDSWAVEGINIWEIQELDSSDDTGILIGVSYEFREEVEQVLIRHGFLHYMYGF